MKLETVRGVRLARQIDVSFHGLFSRGMSPGVSPCLTAWSDLPRFTNTLQIVFLSPEHRVAELPAAVPALRAVHAGLHGGGGVRHDVPGRDGLQKLLLPRLVAVSQVMVAVAFAIATEAIGGMGNLRYWYMISPLGAVFCASAAFATAGEILGNTGSSQFDGVQDSRTYLWEDFLLQRVYRTWKGFARS